MQVYLSKEAASHFATRNIWNRKKHTVCFTRNQAFRSWKSRRRTCVFPDSDVHGLREARYAQLHCSGWLAHFVCIDVRMRKSSWKRPCLCRNGSVAAQPRRLPSAMRGRPTTPKKRNRRPHCKAGQNPHRRRRPPKSAIYRRNAPNLPRPMHRISNLRWKRTKSPRTLRSPFKETERGPEW